MSPFNLHWGLGFGIWDLKPVHIIGVPLDLGAGLATDRSVIWYLNLGLPF